MKILVPIKKAGASLSVDWDSLPEASKAYVIEYGLRQSLNDAHASIDGKAPNAAADSLKAAEERLADIVAGTVGIRAVLSDREKAIREVLFGWLKGAGLKATDAKKDSADGWSDSNAEVIARATVAKKLGMKSSDVTEDQWLEAASKIEAVFESKVSALIAEYEAARAKANAAPDLADII